LIPLRESFDEHCFDEKQLGWRQDERARDQMAELDTNDARAAVATVRAWGDGRRVTAIYPTIKAPRRTPCERALTYQ